MGGHSGGEVASAMAVKTLEKVFPELKFPTVEECLEEAIKLCNQSIFEQSRTNPELSGMGTTLTAVTFSGKEIVIGQVGDSRCYVYNEGELFQITEDHSQVYELLKAGLISEQNAASFQRNVITRSVGYEQNVQVDILRRMPIKKERYLICSDGLSGMVSNEQIARCMQNFDVDRAVDNLIALANAQGGEDNISAIVFEIL